MQFAGVAFVFFAIMSMTVLSPYPQKHLLIIDREAAIKQLNRREADETMIEVTVPETGVTYSEAIRLPGVLLYGFSFFCVKFIVNALLLWNPMFLEDELGYEKFEIANMQTAYDVGNLFGGVVLGWMSDWCYQKRSPVGAMAVVVSFAFFLQVSVNHKTVSPEMFALVMFIMGLMMGGLHHLLSITCAADIGQQKALTQNKQATSTVTSIIDGMGSMGTSIG